MPVVDILPLLNGRSFDSATIRVMERAFNKAIKKLPETGQRALARQVLAERIIDIAKRGERDPDELARRALHELGLSLTD
jgi:hypothetical protein